MRARWSEGPVPPEVPVPECDCGKPAGVAQSRDEDTAARAHYCCQCPYPDTRCYFFQWIDGPDKFDPRYLLFDPWGPRPRDKFERWVPPLPNLPRMTEEEMNKIAIMRLENPPYCNCGSPARICPKGPVLRFICPHDIEERAKWGMYGTCNFNELMFGARPQWPEPGEVVFSQLRDAGLKAFPRTQYYFNVRCQCGVVARFGIVPSGLGVGHFCGHMVGDDESTRKCGWEDFFQIEAFYKYVERHPKILEGRMLEWHKKDVQQQYELGIYTSSLGKIQYYDRQRVRMQEQGHMPSADTYKLRSAREVHCHCGTRANSGIVPSGLGIGHYCGHMVRGDESSRRCDFEYYIDKEIIDEYIAYYTMRGEKIGRHPEVLNAFLEERKTVIRKRASARCVPTTEESHKYVRRLYDMGLLISKPKLDGEARKTDVAEETTTSEGPSKDRTKRDGLPVVLCRCGVKARGGLVPSGLGFGNWCGHMVGDDLNTRQCHWEEYIDKDMVEQYKTSYTTEELMQVMEERKRVMRDMVARSCKASLDDKRKYMNRLLAMGHITFIPRDKGNQIDAEQSVDAPEPRPKRQTLETHGKKPWRPVLSQVQEVDEGSSSANPIQIDVNAEADVDNSWDTLDELLKLATTVYPPEPLLPNTYELGDDEDDDLFVQALENVEAKLKDEAAEAARMEAEALSKAEASEAARMEAETKLKEEADEACRRSTTWISADEWDDDDDDEELLCPPSPLCRSRCL